MPQFQVTLAFQRIILHLHQQHNPKQEHRLSFLNDLSAYLLFSGYTAPEVKESKPFAELNFFQYNLFSFVSYSFSANIYSLGVLAVVLYSGMEPTMTGLTQAQIDSLSRLSQPTQELTRSMLNVVSICLFISYSFFLSLSVGSFKETNNIIV